MTPAGSMTYVGTLTSWRAPRTSPAIACRPLVTMGRLGSREGERRPLHLEDVRAPVHLEAKRGETRAPDPPVHVAEQHSEVHPIGAEEDADDRCRAPRLEPREPLRHEVRE